MAGFGSSFLATQRPGYFGTLVPMSGLVSIRRPEVEQGLSAISGVPYQDVWGAWDGFYAEGHDPMTLVPNLKHTKVILRTGNGVPRPGVPADERDLASGALEAYLLTQNEEFAGALREAGWTWTTARTRACTTGRTGARTSRRRRRSGCSGVVPAVRRGGGSTRRSRSAGGRGGSDNRFNEPPGGLATFERDRALRVAG